MLIDSTIAPGCESETTHPTFGVSVSSVTLQGVNKSYVYAKVDQYILTKSKALLALMTRHFNGLYESVYWNDPTNPDALFRDRLPDQDENKQLTVIEADNLGYPKITASHHIHFNVKEAYVSVNSKNRHKADFALRLPKDATSTMAAGSIIWMSSLSDEMFEYISKVGISKCKTVKQFIKIAKSISVEAKSLQNLLNLDLRSIFEIDVITNRVDGEVDWELEKEHRINPVVANLTYSSVFNAANLIFCQAAGIGREPVKMDWKDYWASRWQWSASGSVHSQHISDESYIIKTDRNLKNKFIMISNMPNFEMSHFSSRVPEIHAWASTKYEWGKLRAIYGTDTTSYILSNFAFYNCENVLPNRFPVGKDANDTNVTNRVAGVLKDRLPFCLDFEDFNSQHSLSSMMAVVDAYGYAFRGTLTKDQQIALNWTSKSISRQIIHDNVGLKQQYKANGTLLSGWRLTTFVNSVLNAIYTDKLLTGILAKGSSLHNGDDVLIGTNNMEVTRRCLQIGKLMGIRVQPSKCAFGAIAEFLRVDHVRGSKGQYLTRAVSTLVHSRIESKPSTDARDIINSMENRFSDCLNRGMTIQTIATLRYLYYKHQSKVCNMTVDEFYKIKTTHRVAGGISEAADSTVKWFIKPGDTEKGEIEVPKMAGVGAYAWEVAKSLEMEDRVEELIKRVYKATYEAVVPKNRRMTISVNKNTQWCTNVKNIYKAFKGTVTTAGFGKAALVGFAIDILQTRSMESTLAQALQRSKDPERLLRHLV